MVDVNNKKSIFLFPRLYNVSIQVFFYYLNFYNSIITSLYIHDFRTKSIGDVLKKLLKKLIDFMEAGLQSAVVAIGIQI